IFCAKEAIFKALYPLTRVWLDFLAAELRWLPAHDAFDALLRLPAGERFPVGSALRVDCRFVDGLVLATTFVEPAARAAPGSSPPSPALPSPALPSSPGAP
ncbi:MAG TPA: 4'-phosphopantetheinyl transferase superfamily protein, partial [Chloroflexota bacterium]|nr:4'-phosphopantetheinyl transferase superfamily protein [Chloroflexota bacterium]